MMLARGSSVGPTGPQVHACDPENAAVNRR